MFKTGDTLRHKATGRHWIVARTDDSWQLMDLECIETKQTMCYMFSRSSPQTFEVVKFASRPNLKDWYNT